MREVFFDLLPPQKRIGIDIDPKKPSVIKKNYLNYKLPNLPLIVIGNPPFGHRGVVALEFINHSQSADFVCFILPMFFTSKGKGSIKYRVKNFFLIHSENLTPNSFYTKNQFGEKKITNVKCVFQIWSKKNFSSNNDYDLSWYALKKHNPFKKYIAIFTVSLAKKRECGKKWIFEKKADFYLATTFYKKNKVVFDFQKVKYKSGLAIIIKTKVSSEIAQIKKIFLNADWKRYSSLSTNSCRHISKFHIYQLLKNNNFTMENV